MLAAMSGLVKFSEKMLKGEKLIIGKKYFFNDASDFTEQGFFSIIS